MSKKQFTLDSWLKDKSQKVVTRCGFPVRIVCTDVKRKDYPILALVERDDQEEYQSFTKDGRFSLYNPLHDNFDLFIETADEVSEDEKIRKEILSFCQNRADNYPNDPKYANIGNWISWLEKQGEQIDIANKEYWRGYREGKKEILDKYAEQSEQKPNPCDGCVNRKGCINCENGELRETEQKPVIKMKTPEESLGISSDEYNKIVDECLFGEQKLTEFERGLFDMLTDISKPRTADCVKSHSEKLLSIARKMIALEQKPEEDKGNIGEISSNSEWCEENEPHKELAESYLAKFDEKFPILPTLKGKQLADYKNFLNKCQQIFRLKYWDIRPIQAKLFEKLSLLWAAWGAEHLQGLGQTDGDMDNEISMWSEEDETVLNNLIYALVNDRIGNNRDEYVDWLKSIKSRVQPKQEWSEDDETALTNTIIMLKEGASHHFLNSSIVPCVNWLKSLKDRVGCEANCTTIKEWSKEDSFRTETLISVIKSGGSIRPELRNEFVNWLKSLRPQNHWKPSDEQMEALWLYAEQNNYDGAVLTSLYNDLKKLKEK